MTKASMPKAMSELPIEPDSFRQNARPAPNRSNGASMHGLVQLLGSFLLFICAANAFAQAAEKVVDIPTRPDVTLRMVVSIPQGPKGTVILFAGGDGGLQTTPDGSFKRLGNNFLLRSRYFFVEQGLATVVVDAPSDRQQRPYLSGFRDKPEHAADIKAAIAWSRQQVKAPVWLVGTSRGTQSAAYAGAELGGPDGPDGLVLTSTLLTDTRELPVLAMPLEKIRIPVLVAHHEQDGCGHCLFSAVPELMEKLGNAPRKQLLPFKGGGNRGDPCQAFAYHGFNGLEREVVMQISNWILQY